MEKLFLVACLIAPALILLAIIQKVIDSENKARPPWEQGYDDLDL